MTCATTDSTPRSRVSGDLEHHFTEHAASLTFMASHRYLVRLAAIAENLPGAAAEDGSRDSS